MYAYFQIVWRKMIGKRNVEKAHFEYVFYVSPFIVKCENSCVL